MPRELGNNSPGAVSYPPALGNLPPCTGEFIRRHWGIYPPALGNLPPGSGEFTPAHWGIYPPALGNLPPPTGEFTSANWGRPAGCWLLSQGPLSFAACSPPPLAWVHRDQSVRAVASESKDRRRARKGTRSSSPAVLDPGPTAHGPGWNSRKKTRCVVRHLDLGSRGRQNCSRKCESPPPPS